MKQQPVLLPGRKSRRRTRTTHHLLPYANSPFLNATVVKPNNRKNLIFPGEVSSCAGGPFVIQIVTKASDPAHPSSPSESEPTPLLLLLLLQIRDLRLCSARSSLLTSVDLQSASLCIKIHTNNIHTIPTKLSLSHLCECRYQNYINKEVHSCLNLENADYHSV